MLNSVTYEEWLRRLYDHISPNFYRAEPRTRAWAYLCSLADTPADGRASRRHLATYPGERRADGAQRLLTSAQWDEEQVKTDLLGFIKNRFGACGGTLYVTEMAFRKKGMHAAGVQRQFSVETSRYENCQIGILLFYEAPDGSLLLVDRDLYVPQNWIDEPARCGRAAMPAELSYRSKSAIAVNLVARAMSAGILPEWVLLSILCADKASAQKALQQEGIPHVMTLTPGEFGVQGRLHGSRVRAVSQESFAATASVPASREQHWDVGRSIPVRLRRMTLASSPMPGFDVSYLTDSVALRGSGRSGGHYYAYTTRDTNNHNLAEVVSNLKGLAAHASRCREEIGIDHYEVRSWRGWYRHMALAMVACTANALSKIEKSETAKSGCWAS